jgi:hypothetical protein
MTTTQPLNQNSTNSVANANHGLTQSGENQTIYRFRLIGYGLLAFFLIDFLHTLLPVEGFSNTWMLQVVSALVERAIVPILGMALVFFGEFYARRPQERVWLKLLSWLTLLLAIAYFLLLVPLIGNTLQLSLQLQQLPQPLTQLEKFEERVQQSQPEELTQIKNYLVQVGVPIHVTKPDELRKEISNQIQQARPKIEAQWPKLQQQIQQQNAVKQTRLLKDSTRWGIGTILASVLFFWLWKSAGWARSK